MKKVYNNSKTKSSELKLYAAFLVRQIFMVTLGEKV